MVLIIGGCAQGKLTYAMRTFSLTYTSVTQGACCAREETFSRPCLNHLEEWVRRFLPQMGEEGICRFFQEHQQAWADMIFICNETGSGIVPMKPEERAWREAVGRLCCMLALRAQEVHRVYCGMGTLLRGRSDDD